MSEYLDRKASSFSPAGGANVSNGTEGKPEEAIAMMIFSCSAGPAKVVLYDDAAPSGAAAPLDPTADPLLTVQLAAGQTWSPPIGAKRAMRFDRGIFYIVLSGTDVFVGCYAA